MNTARIRIPPSERLVIALTTTILAGCFQPALEQADTDAAADVPGDDSATDDTVNETADTSTTETLDHQDTSAEGEAETFVPECDDDGDCESADLCIIGERCEAGTCVDGVPNPCTAIDSCHGKGLCDAATGVCSTPVRLDGSPCDDADPCTHDDRCSSGICAGVPGPDGTSVGATRGLMYAEGPVRVTSLTSTADGKTFGVVHSPTASFTLEVEITKTFTGPQGAVEALFLTDLTGLFAPQVTATAFAWTDTPTGSNHLTPTTRVRVSADRNLLVPVTFTSPFITRGEGVVGEQVNGATGAAILRVRRNGDVAGGVEYLGVSGEASAPASAPMGADHVVAVVASLDDAITIRALGGSPTTLPAPGGDGLRSLVERRTLDDVLVYRRFLEVEGDGVAVVFDVHALDDETVIVGVATGPLLLRDADGQTLGTIGNGLSTMEAFAVWLSADGQLTHWRTFFGHPDSLSLLGELAPTATGLAAVLSSDSPMSTLAARAGEPVTLGPQTATSSGLRAQLVSIDRSGVEVGPTFTVNNELVVTATSPTSGQPVGIGAGKVALAALGLAASPSSAEWLETPLAAAGHALHLEGHGHRQVALVARRPGWDTPVDPNVPYDPYGPPPRNDGPMGSPRISVQHGGAVLVAGSFIDSVMVGYSYLATLTSPSTHTSTYLYLTNVDLTLLCRDVFP
jgi:hypothetical protein